VLLRVGAVVAGAQVLAEEELDLAFIDKHQRRFVYTDFEDEIGSSTDVELPGLTAGADFEKFRAKARAYLRAHQDNVAVRKVILNKPLTPGDLSELERILAESGAGGADEITRAKEESQGLGLFVRSLVGLDREAAKAALAGFLSGRTLTANQIDFVNLVVNQLTERGVVNPAALYASPFTDLTARGPEGLFKTDEVNQLVHVLEGVRATALAA
jgi:type I restriction enzyme, R subunit